MKRRLLNGAGLLAALLAAGMLMGCNISIEGTQSLNDLAEEAAKSVEASENSDADASADSEPIAEQTAYEEDSAGESDSAAENGEYNISSDMVKTYYKGSYGEDEEEIKMYFLNDNKQIAYYDMDTLAALMNKLYREGYGDYDKDPNYSVSYETDGDKVIFTRENGYTMTLDFTEDNVFFDDFDKFICHSYDMTTVDLAHTSGYNDDGQPVYLKRDEEASFSRFGKEMIFDLKKYDIDLVEDDGLYLIPAQTMNDILLTTTYTEYLYNGECAIYANYNNLVEDMTNGTGLSDIYYRDDMGTMSRELIDFSYNELCMVLDYEYGLKESHSIEDFDSYFQEIAVRDDGSLKDMLTGDDPVKAEKALYILTVKAFDDLHSYYCAPGAYAGRDNTLKEIANLDIGVSRSTLMGKRSELMQLRSEALSDKDGNIPGYQEVGNTAYVTFDSFTRATKDYYADPPESAPADTMGLLIYAQSQIKREDSPIENVVIDLTCNTGGEEDAVAYVCAWFLGESEIYLQNAVTSASSENVYLCDTNLDHEFDESDNVSDLNLFCLTSPVSFSCGNLAPAMFACSGKVTLIGQTTGGGSCVVLPLTTATGSMLRISGFRMISTMKNGSFYNVDQGVEPDFHISDYEHIYDREYLTDYINNLP